MATQDQVMAKAIYCIGNQKPHIEMYPEKASADFIVGSFVQIDSGTGQIFENSSNDVVTLGIALKAATGTAGSDIPVLLAEHYQVFEVNATGAVTAITQRNENFELTVDTYRGFCDVNANSYPFFRVHKLAPQDAVGDTYGRLHVRVIPSVYQGNAG